VGPLVLLMEQHDDGLVDAALRIAVRAHAGQADKAGLPYIEHPTRVAARLATSELKAVALLHDVLEDTDVTVEDLAAAGLPKAVIDGVIAMTKRPGDDYPAAVARAARHPLARAVKAADIADNADPQRLALLPTSEAQRLREKYELGRRVLANEAERQLPATGEAAHRLG